MINKTLNFGKFKGELWTRVPVHYLVWMVNSNHSKAEAANVELKRRGTVLPELEISGHAIDRASLHCRKLWHRSRGDNEGLHGWLLRMCVEALKGVELNENDVVYYNGLKLIFAIDCKWPVLKTVMPIKK